MQQTPLTTWLVMWVGAGILLAGCDHGVSTSALPETAGQTPPARQIVYQDETTTIFRIEPPDHPPVYEAQIQARARSGRFLIVAELDSNLTITQIQVPSYAGDRGRAVTSPAFTGQFIGKGAGSPLVVGGDIHAITGATLSAQAMTEQVRRTIERLEQTKP